MAEEFDFDHEAAKAVARAGRMVYASMDFIDGSVILVADPEAELAPDQRWHGYVDLAIAQLKQEVATARER